MDPTTQQGFAMAAIGFAGTVAGLFFGWLKDRDKLKYDKQLAAQDAEITALKAQNFTQAAQIAELKADHEACQEDNARTQEQLKDCADKHETTEARLAEVEAAIAQFKKQ